MTNRRAVYRDYDGGPWNDEPLPGPLPQAVTRQFPTSRTHCTCGHAGPSHKRQTLTTGEYSQTDALRFRGDCSAVIKVERGSRHDQWGDGWGLCPCTWFTEDLDNPPDPQPEVKRGPGRPRTLPRRADGKVAPKYYNKIKW